MGEPNAAVDDDDAQVKQQEGDNDALEKQQQQTQKQQKRDHQEKTESGGGSKHCKVPHAGGVDQKAGGSASSVAPTEDAESQATTTNVDESGDSETGAHNEPGKMFVGGLSWQTSAEGLRDYFCKFGEVNECMVMRDPTTKRARGFGFITFADPNAVDLVLSLESHELDGKRIDPKVAFPKKQQPKMVVKTKKIFIGGLSSSSTLEDIKRYFSQYGQIDDAMLMFDKSTQRHRGFGFITFDDDEVSDKVCEIHFHEINGKMVECKKAQPKEVMLPLQLNKTRAAAARNLYGLAPEQLLAYASYIPRLQAAAAYASPPVPSHHPAHHHHHNQQHHHGMSAALTAAAVSGYHHHHPSQAGSTGAELQQSVDLLRIAPATTAVSFPGNGFAPPPQHHHHQQQLAHHFAALGGHGVAAKGSHHFGGGANGACGALNPRDLAAAQLVAQQQAVYEAAMVYANQLSTLAASASADFSAAAASGTTHYAFGHAQHHHQQHHGQHAHSAPMQPHPQLMAGAQFPKATGATAALPHASSATALLHQQTMAAQQQKFGGGGVGGVGKP